MAGKKAYDTLTDRDLCEYLHQVEGEYPVRVRVSLVPLARKSGSSTHAITARAYNSAGRPIMDLEVEQVLFPGATSRTFAGAAFYACTALVSRIDEWHAQELRRTEQMEPGRLTPLEEYIAKSTVS